jgi:hypothetical protein
MASFIRIGVPDLTRIAYRCGGEFPSEEVRRAIDGRLARAAHGSREMPVWGWQLHNVSNTDEAGEQARIDATIHRLVEHVRSIQQ